MGQGGLVQLVAYGNQDLFLTSNPSITFFKSAMRRYTAFACESIELLPSSASDFGRKSVFVVSRNGDLAGASWVQLDLPALTAANVNQVFSYTRFLAHALLEEVSVSIGGSTIDRHVSEWYQVLFELQMPASKEAGYLHLIGERPELIETRAAGSGRPAATLWCPLQFWFNRSAGLALPLIALQFHETRIEVSVRALSQVVVITAGSTALPTPSGSLGITIWQDYYYLDVAERSSVASEAQEQVIDLLSFTGVETVTGQNYKSRLAFNHPSKYFCFVIRPDQNTASGANRWLDFSLDTDQDTVFYEGVSPLRDAVLLLNGNERFAKRTAEFFSMIQRDLQRFTRCSSKGTVYVYSFSLFPETSQPSGTLNCSRIDSISWVLTFAASGTYQVFFFSNHINILRIKSGMAGLAFSS